MTGWRSRRRKDRSWGAGSRKRPGCCGTGRAGRESKGSARWAPTMGGEAIDRLGLLRKEDQAGRIRTDCTVQRRSRYSRAAAEEGREEGADEGLPGSAEVSIRRKCRQED